MICSCTCSGGSASIHLSSRKRASRTSCQVCGGKKLAENSGTVSPSMVSTVGVELTSVINNDLRWKTISKGNRSSSRRPRRPVTKFLKEGEDLLNKDPKREDMPVSESEKLGVTVLGRRFSEKIEHVPIKKRRFLFESPSPPLPTHSPPPEKIEQLARSQSASCRESFTNTTAEQQDGATDDTISTELGQVLDADRKNCEVICSKLEETEDFSGISMLAAAACNDSIEDVTGSTVEDAFVPEGYSEVLPISNSMAIQSCKTFALACSYAVSIEKNTSSSATTNSSPRNLAEMDTDTTLGKNMEVRVPDNAKATLTNVPGDKHDETQGLNSSLSGDRLHWDLNVVMDAWEEDPCEDTNKSGQVNAVSGVGYEKSDNSEVCRLPGEMIERTVQTMDDSIIAANMPENVNCHEDARSLIPEKIKSNREVNASPVASEISKLPEKLAPMELDSAPENVINLQTETKAIHDQERISICALPSSPASIEKGEIVFSHGLSKEDAAGGHSLSTDVDGKQFLEEGINGASSIVEVIQRMGDSYVDGQSGGIVCLKEGTRDEKQHVPAVQVSNKTSSQELECEPVDDVMCKLDTVGASQSSPDLQKLSTKNHVVINNEKGQEGIIDLIGGEDQSGAEVVSSPKVDFKELSPKLLKETLGVVDASVTVGCLVASQEASKSSVDDHLDCSGKIALEEGPFADSDPELDESGDNHTDLLDNHKASELQDGYGSQYEDGELREPYVHSWEEDLGEEGDAEHVDYGSDNRDTYAFDAADYSDSKVQTDEGMECSKENPSEFAYVGSEVDQLEQQVVHRANSQFSLGNSLKKGIPVTGSCKPMAAKVVKQQSMGPSSTFDIDARVDQEELSEGSYKLSEHDNSFGIADESKESFSASRMKLYGLDQLPERGRGSADTSMEIRDGSDNQNQMKACINGFDSKETIARFGRREIQSRVDRTTSTCVLLRNDRTSIQRNRSKNFDDANYSDVRGIGSFKPLHSRGRGAGDDRRTDSSGRRQWGPNRHSSSYYNDAGFVHSGPKRAPVATYYRQYANGSPQAVHQSYSRRGSPSDKGEAFRVHIGNGPMGERSLDRSSNVGRGRPVRYGPRVVGTVSRDRCNGSAPDDSIGSFHNMHPLHRRDQSFSPIRRREVLRESRSRSRSRTRSPGMWPSPRGRVGPGFRQCSRSPPNFRYDARMDRIRSPHRRAGFGADRLVGFPSAPRGRGSPPHTSKWIGDRKNVDHFREHGYKQRSDSSPERLFRRAQRFDLVDSTVRFRQDDFYRPMHPRRFSEMVGTGRGTRYYGSDDGRRKHSDRHFDADGTVKRFPYDVEDGFEVRHSRNKVAPAFRGRGSTKDYVRGIDSRLGGAPGQDREKDRYRYGRDGKFNNANTKSFGMGDCEEEIATGRRPS